MYGSLSELVDVLANTAQCQRDVSNFRRTWVPQLTGEGPIDAETWRQYNQRLLYRYRKKS